MPIQVLKINTLKIITIIFFAIGIHLPYLLLHFLLFLEFLPISLFFSFIKIAFYDILYSIIEDNSFKYLQTFLKNFHKILLKTLNLPFQKI